MTEQENTQTTNILSGVAELLDKQEARRDERWNRIESRMTYLAASIDEMRGQHNRRFDRMNDERDLANIVAEKRYIESTMRLSALEDRMTELEARFVQLERRMKALEDVRDAPLIVAQLNDIGAES